MDNKKLTQKELILKMLLRAQDKGINSYGVARTIALQLPARIYELKKEYDIVATRNKNGSVNYILKGELA